MLAMASVSGAAENTAVESTAAENTTAESTAAVITTADGVLSIEVSGDEWKEKEDSEYWFEVSDGKNSIAIDHLSNGEDLPEAEVAGEEYEAVYQAFVSTKNEVFIVKGLAASQEELEDVMRMIGTIKVLKYDTKTAVQKETQAMQTAQTTQSGIRAINATYYVTADVLNVRGSDSSDGEVIGTLYKGEAVTVIGAVTKDGSDTGWYQIQYSGKDGYVSSAYLSQTAPAGTTGGTGQTGQSGTEGMVQCERCGQWFPEDQIRDHQLGHSMDDLYAGKVQCERCGEWFPEDEIRDHQLGHTMEDMNGGN